ncbi:MAG: hypothetical protein E7350_03590 [Clostridiales bacterium]|nr:hypothetical protein [Clostridiales bacterium]
MKRLIYLLELVDYDYFDEVENVDVEERWIIGYFSSEESLNDAISLCNQRKNKNEKITITQKLVECGNNQKYVYVLFYEYSIITDGEYVDYYEYFDPQSTYKKCIALKNELIKDVKYQNDGHRIYDGTTDGFRVYKIKIDFISHINYKMQTEK